MEFTVGNECMSIESNQDEDISVGILQVEKILLGSQCS